MDDGPLTKSEKLLVGKFPSFQSMLTSRISTGSLYRSGSKSGSLTASARDTKDNTPASSVGSIQSFQLNGTNGLPQQFEFFFFKYIFNLWFLIVTEDSDEIVHKKTPPKKKIRKAPISEDETPITCVPPPADQDTSTNLEGNKDHLVTKRQIEQLIEKHGDGWLSQHGMKLNDESLTGQQLHQTSSDFFETEIEQLQKDIEPLSDTRAETSTPVNEHKEKFDSVESPISLTVNILISIYIFKDNETIAFYNNTIVARNASPSYHFFRSNDESASFRP